MLIKNAVVFQERGEFTPGDIAISGQYFSEASAGEDVFDASGCYAIPGLIDVHLHGCVRHDFSDGDAAGIEAMAGYQAQNGVTAICPATMTLPEESLAAACRAMAAYSGENGAAIVGINLEGPFISPGKLGAQNPAYVRKPDEAMVRRLQQAANGLVKLLAIAPETEGAMELIGAVSGEIVCSLAHTAADYKTAAEAFSRGARQVTHLYNAMPPFTHREPGVVGAALDCPECRVELICDNVHIHPSVVRATLRMFGDDRVIMISDSMMATGMKDGDYELGGLAVQVKGNTARLAENGAIAGSVTNLMNCVRTAVKEMGVPLASAVKCASVNPAKAIGVFDERGSIAPGKYADLVLLREDLSIHSVFLKGKMLQA
jgi:N-acetylglucosamine-6-phosphate deacetylase